MNSDFKELLNLFNNAAVKYLIIGGYAVTRYAEPRYTKDLDLWVEATIANATGVFNALKQFGAPLSDLTVDDFAKAENIYQMGRPPVRVDVFMSIPGLDFAVAWEQRENVNFDGVQAWMLSKEHLIASKLAAGRPQDLLDVEALKAND